MARQRDVGSMIRTPSRLSQLRTVLGIVDLIFPGTVLGLARTQAMDRRSRKVVQILGVRQLVQAAVTGSRPTGTVLVRGALVDAGHAVSMAALALLNRRWRRAALVDAAIVGDHRNSRSTINESRVLRSTKVAVGGLTSLRWSG
jgi:ABC-type Fe3+ transport system permease subunit